MTYADMQKNKIQKLKQLLLWKLLHIGTNEKPLLDKRIQLYDFICKPTKLIEPYMEDLINSWFENDGKPVVEDIGWELRSLKGTKHSIDTEVSVYEEHFDYLKETLEYAKANKMGQRL